MLFYLDASTPPQEIVLEWKATDATGFEHRAYWGANLIANGTKRHAQPALCGALPATGVWTRLEVPASLVDLEAECSMAGAFYLFDGRCDSISSVSIRPTEHISHNYDSAAADIW